MIQERRRASRYRIDMTVMLGGGKARIIDFSACGVFVETSRRFAPGEDVPLIFPLEQTGPGASVTCSAQVLRIEPRGELFGIAAAFEPVAITVPA